ncbi:MAG: GMC family oxidoreductase N-terminal domain-containing protein [Thiotrichales bacterium]|nr:GMC family oxidoreductase N-terminal domain-containing protein [Thiotrichales bacterium]
MPDDLVHEWREKYNLTHFTPDVLSQYYDQVEKDISVSYLPNEFMAPPPSLKLKKGAEVLGWNVLEVPRWFRYESSQDSNGVKQSMTETLLKRAVKLGVQFKSEARVNKLKRNGAIWEVEALSSQVQRSVYYANYVFICAGAIDSAHLLLKNKLHPQAGGKLHMHPSIKMVAEFDEEVNFVGMGVPVHQVKEFSPLFSMGCSISSKPYLKLAMMDTKCGFEIVDAKWKRMAIYYAMVGDGIGRVRSLPFMSDPLVTYKLGSRGVKNILTAFERLAECLFHAGAKVVYPSFGKSRPLTSMAEVKAFLYEIRPKDLALMTIHLFSSCAMSELGNGVTDSFGKVKGQEGLYVNDTSILCGPLSVNPQGTVMAIAYRNIDNFIKSTIHG